MPDYSFANHLDQTICRRLAEIHGHLELHRQRHGQGVHLHIPWPSMLSRLGVGRSVAELLKEKPRPCPLRNDCLIDAAGCIYERNGDELIRCERRKAGRHGRLYCSVPRDDGEEFKLWCLNEVYGAFIGRKPKAWKVEPLDHDHENTGFDNLLLRSDPAADNDVSMPFQPFLGIIAA